MATLNQYLDQQLSSGRTYFTRQQVFTDLGLSPAALLRSTTRLVSKHRLISPKRGFFLILRPEDRVTGAPDPARWIDPLMKYLEVDYRISLLRAAAFHGSSHQAAMTFQVIAPKQVRPIVIGRHKIQFIYQAPAAFSQSNQAQWLDKIKTDAGYAKVAGVELTLLDCARYFHKAAGINGAAQVIHDLGAKAEPTQLRNAAQAYENSAVRRLGYLLEHFGHVRPAQALATYARTAKSLKPLDPSVKPLAALPDAPPPPRDSKWKLILNETVEIDT